MIDNDKCQIQYKFEGFRYEYDYTTYYVQGVTTSIFRGVTENTNCDLLSEVTKMRLKLDNRVQKTVYDVIKESFKIKQHVR